jgi:copper homeostasis protein CutC
MPPATARSCSTARSTRPSPLAVLDELAAIGVDRVLTSGGAARSVDGTDMLRRLVAADTGIEIMAGGGIRVGDIARIVAVGVDAVHLSARAVTGLDAPSGPGEERAATTSPTRSWRRQRRRPQYAFA